MPARVGPLCAAALQQPPPLLQFSYQRQQHKLYFHSTSARRDDIDDKNHYETLNIQTNASPTDIKKSFYTLSKTHHPDHNRSDPNASRRFMRISEAYSTLSNTEKRAKYDRDILRLHDHGSHQSQTNSQRKGSYFSSSGGPAGGRPASGLSRRRGTFRGPPPSFYRSGGWGAHGAKRSAAHEGSTSGGSNGAWGYGSNDNNNNTSGYTSQNAGGMGPGQEPFGRGSGSEIPHFDRMAQTQHTRTHARVDARRTQRTAQDYDPFPDGGEDMGDIGRLFAILGVLGLGGLVPYLLLRGTGATEGKKAKT